jgi:hypothetical protein
MQGVIRRATSMLREYARRCLLADYAVAVRDVPRE